MPVSRNAGAVCAVLVMASAGCEGGEPCSTDVECRVVADDCASDDDCQGGVCVDLGGDSSECAPLLDDGLESCADDGAFVDEPVAQTRAARTDGSGLVDVCVPLAGSCDGSSCVAFTPDDA